MLVPAPARYREPVEHRAGICAIVGRPNVGKSTLLNAIVGEKVAITTPVPQTTRFAIRGVLTRRDAQVVFVDTPGVHRPRTLLGSRLNDAARAALEGVDLALLVVDGAAGVGGGDAYLAELVAASGVPAFAVLNKVDRLRKGGELPGLAALAELDAFAEVVPVSARRGDQVALLVDLIVGRMPEGPPVYPDAVVTDATLEQRIAEVIREKAMTAMREEVPHSIAVLVEEIQPGRRDDVVVVHADIHVERDSQKGIVIGHRGGVLARIGTDARPEVEQLVGTRVYLDLRVKTTKEWQRDPKQLDRLGY
jgi:GTPase